jgi:nickel/cobalt transporter (NicO) family protein
MKARTGWRTAIFVFVAAALLASGAALAKGPFGVGAPDMPGGAFTGPFGSFFYWVAEQQSAFYKLLIDALKQFKANNHAAFLLGGVSFAYGVFHAAGPGHGKAVITSYLLASRQTAKRGILIAFGSALLQGLTAITIVLIATVVLRMTSIGLTKAADAFEIASYALVAMVGAWLLWSKLMRPGHAHTQADAAASAGSGNGDHQPHDHDHAHIHGHGCTCCSHAPAPKLLDRRLTLRQAWTAIFAVGIRPCSGALIVLVFALSQQLFVAGIVSVLVMSLGTAITVSTLVILAVSAQALSLRYAEANSRTFSRILRGGEIALALFVMLFGLTLFGGSVVAFMR